MHPRSFVSSSLAACLFLIALALVPSGFDGDRATFASEEALDQSRFFRDEVAPILRQRCYPCHSHESHSMEAGLALDFKSGWETGGDSGPAIRPGDADASLLIQAVRRDGELMMPPDAPLSSEEVDVLVQWVNAGAFDDRLGAPEAPEAIWWSLQPLQRPLLPDSDPAHLPPGVQLLNPIDHFVQSELVGHELHFSPLADRRTQIRRLSIDLLGLLPSMDEVAAFERDTRPDAYERLVDRMLASPAYGERWARHWMDTVHFADTHGFEHDVARPNAWRYRDYLIARLNGDVAWSRFIREQLAADHFFPDEPQWTSALGFLAAGPFDISSFTTAPLTFAYLDRDDMVTQTMSAFTSSTVNCARCHAHKFDPIPQDDYFALQAVFAGVIKGDVAYDTDPRVAAERRKWEGLIELLSGGPEDKLPPGFHLDPWKATIAQWEQSHHLEAALWRVRRPESFTSSNGCVLSVLEDDSVLASAPYPERERYVLRLRPGIGRLTAIRIEVLPHNTLPAGGPGCASNGNLHLTSLEAQLLIEATGEKRPVKFSKASADFEQTGWTAAHAIDGDAASAWGIHPQEGRAHAIVAELAEALEIPDGCQMEISLNQSHGGSHIIGRLRVSLSDQVSPRLPALSESVLAALRVPADSRTADQQSTIASAALLAHANNELAKLPAPALVYAAAKRVRAGNGVDAQSIEQPHTIEVLSRGDLSKPLRRASPGALSAVGALEARFKMDEAGDESARRAALADWLAATANPLTWRSLANRLWHYHFGRGLSDTPNDLGRMGGAVSHPKLLDWLACECRDGEQSLKHLHRLIVTSHVYRQAAVDDPQRAARDSDNRWLWRQHRRRLDAECYRDAVLQISGGLDRAMGGPGVEHFTTSPGPQMTPVLNYDAFDWRSPQGARRSVYRFVWRGLADPLMETLDFPDLGLLAPQRSDSASSLQSLAMYNNRFVLVNSERFAQRVTTGPSGEGRSAKDQLHEAFAMALQRAPTEAELALFLPVAQEYGMALVCRVLFNSNEFLFLD